MSSSKRMNIILKSQAGRSRVDHWGCTPDHLAFSLTKRNLQQPTENLQTRKTTQTKNKTNIQFSRLQQRLTCWRGIRHQPPVSFHNANPTAG